MRSEAVARHGRRVSIGVGVLGTAVTVAGAFMCAHMPMHTALAGSGAVRALRGVPDPHAWGLALCFAGLALLASAWLLLGCTVRRGHVDLGAVRRAVWAWAVPLVVAPPLFSTDGWSYVADGYIFGHGSSPYDVAPASLHGPIVEGVSRGWMDAHAPYGPLPLVWGGAFSHVTTSPWVLMIAYRLLALLGLGMLLWAVPRLASLSGISPIAATWLAASPFVLVTGVGGTHLDLVMIGVAAVALAVTSTRGWLLGAALVGVAASIKAPAAVAGIGVVLLSAPSPSLRARLLHAARVGLVIAGTVAGAGLVTGLGFGWFPALHSTFLLRTPLSLTYQAGQLLHWLGASPDRNTVDTAGLSVLAIALVALLVSTPPGRPPAALRAAALALLLATVLSPVTNYWYFLWCLPLLATVRLSAAARGALAVFVTVLAFLTPLDPSLHVTGMRGTVLLAASIGVLVGAVGGAVLGRRARALPTRALGSAPRPVA